ncbi:hypothetical protein LPJ63_002278 [Coemansia sp. RSA 2711]|nr:hypothetical protein LPJ63_002278 [Coemansia sp. RSA 2711]KAJ2304736.1 hypothetical protein IWW54_005305 [Coemansia sp. RSA 2705]KAJ2722869.1 hypothetical protein H4R23_004424 [Coemansia sp. Cherry 401B]
MADAGEQSGGGSMFLASSLLALALAALIGWYLVQQQSAAISQKSLAIARGTTTRARGQRVVITGPPGTGKTALWLHLRFTATSAGRAVPRTQTSLAVNEADAFVDETCACLVDVPGHPRFARERDEQLRGARAVVFVLDGAAVARDVRPTAEALYDVLACRHVQDSECPVLVVCNKQDDPLALANSRAKLLLEAEFDVLRASRQAGLDSLQAARDADDAAAEERAADYLGVDGKPFAFEDLALPVQFNEASMMVGHDAGGLEHIERWIADALHA